MCILCGIQHAIGEPCDFRQADSLLLGKLNIQPSEPIIVADLDAEEELNFDPSYTGPEPIKKKKGRPYASNRRG